MTREVLARKLSRLRKYLSDLSPHAGRSVEVLTEDPYRVERLLELLVQVAVDIVSHELAERRIVPGSYRAAFLRAGEEGLIPADLAASLAEAAGLRNILVHLYEEIDYAIVSESVHLALVQFRRFLDVYVKRLESHAE